MSTKRTRGRTFGRSVCRDHSAPDDHVYDAGEAEFLLAMDRYRRERGRPFPALSEVLAVLRSLGYAKPPA